MEVTKATEPLVVIGLCGRARAGKDTIAGHLVAAHGFHRIGLADGVRSLLNDLDGATWEFRKERDEAGHTDRWAMQIAGTECRNDVQDAPHWVNHALMKIRFASHFHSRPRRKFVITDVRFPYEANWLRERVREWGGIFECWRVVRPDAPSIAESNHISESLIESVAADAILHNDEGVAELLSLASHCLMLVGIGEHVDP